MSMLGCLALCCVRPKGKFAGGKGELNAALGEAGDKVAGWIMLPVYYIKVLTQEKRLLKYSQVVT